MSDSVGSQVESIDTDKELAAWLKASFVAI
jgi:hypothetical protein